MSIFVFGLHYVGFGLALACLILQRSFLQGESGVRVRFLARVDSIYGVSALVSIGTGLLRVFVYGRGPLYYTTDPVFWVKMGLFALVGVLSIYPTVQFLRNRELTLTDWRRNRPVVVARIQRIIAVEILLYLVLPFVAAQLAHGPHF